MGIQNYNPQKDSDNFPHSVPIEALRIILEQSRKNLCKIKCNDGGNGTGFFCIIPFPDKFKQLPVLITNNHVITKNDIIKNNKIKFTLNNYLLSFEILIDNFRKIYTNEIYDVTIIEIKEKDNLEMNSFLEIDAEIFKDNPKDIFKGKSIYLLSHPYGGDLKFSQGIIKNIEENNYTIRHLCRTNPGSSGCPIINLNNNRVIGIHKGAAKNNRNWNLGTLLKEPIEEFNKKNMNDKRKNNSNNNNIQKEFDKNEDEIDEINIIYKYKKIKNISKEYIKRVKDELGETVSERKIFGEKFVENNKDVCKIMINGKEIQLFSYLNDEYLKLNNKKLELKIKGISKITDSSYMFCGCISLSSLPDIENWKTDKIKNMSFMFFLSQNLINISDISKWNIYNVTNLSGIFQGCSSLTTLPDISKWNTNNVINMSGIFAHCSSLTSLPDISKWNTNKVTDIACLFHKCSSLKILPDISKWNTNNIIDFGCIFNDCSLLTDLPDISKWKTSNVINMNGIFYHCSSLKSLPDISKWDTINVKNMGCIFQDCSLLTTLPDISKWNTNNVTEIGCIF